MTMQVNYDTVTQAASDTTKTASDLTEQLTTLMTHVRNVAGGWDGEAKEAYVAIQSQLTADMDGLTTDLHTIARLLRESVVGYQDTDKGNAARFRMMM
ncbi:MULTISPECIES: WXG100 family type VII secretion target [unclassified Streptomyces]|uniref:WXG100 family type VII secretion target n=1 Tax=unclassified Streptomyces TaxID=2593676 RepID=UPI002DD7D805|nr:WXG100 family type VII secretion target [Streptomyces sp. NBC_01750]WSA99880.1 WXG100 family type VII secretion target [Streptomyces sp. NBC_01794]WSD35688.1 WXG100 family type VII secretion target [Streptomyces sp. NBC_01750]